MRNESLPQGSLRMPGEGFNGVTPKEVVAERTAIYNTPEELKKRFLGDNNPRTLLTAPIKDGSEIRLHEATGPYAPYHYMMFVKGKDFEQNPDGQPIKGELLTDHSHEVQRGYWELLLNGLTSFKETLGTDSDYRVFSGGNWLRNYSNEDERNARTIGFHHDHLMAVKAEFFDDYIDNGVKDIEGFNQEKAATERLLPFVLPKVQTLLGEESPLQLEARTEMPYGYSFTISADTDIDTFTTHMRDHHEAYAAVAKRYEPHGSLLEQPSYNLYVEIDDAGDRHISVSPSFAGPVGVLESAGIQSKRNPEYASKISAEEAAEHQQKVIGKIHGNSSIYTKLPKAA